MFCAHNQIMWMADTGESGHLGVASNTVTMLSLSVVLVSIKKPLILTNLQLLTGDSTVVPVNECAKDDIFRQHEGL